MSTRTAHSNMHAVLSRVNGVTEIRDRHGNVMGTYTPQGKAANGTEKHLLLICFEDGATALFDMKKVRETLAREKGQGRPLREIIAELEARARNET